MSFGKCVVSLSGGMDSSTLLLNVIERVGADNVIAVSFNYGQKHSVELDRAASLVDYLAQSGYPIKYGVINIQGLSKFLWSSLTDEDWEVPEGHYRQDNMKETVVPNRNKIFSSITQAIALSEANKTQTSVAIALGIHAGDHTCYPDCRQEFRDADDIAFKLGNWDAERVSYYSPYLYDDKLRILEDGQRLCDSLGLNFNEVYSRTNTSYKPICIGGQWYSDYKSASSTERIEAFIFLGVPDPVQYADETGLVSWETARDYALKCLQDFMEVNCP